MPTITLQTPTNSYPIKIQPLEEIHHSSKVLIITNPKVGGLYLEQVLAKLKAKEVFVCSVNDGEEYKTMRTIEQILESAFIARLDRKSLMIALGGGVISDMVGFASGIYERGIDFVSIPTTLLAQVDASVGGKCGINNTFGKNLVGIFHQPKAVHIDSSFLSTLPSREISAGIAEMIKMAICFDKQGFTQLEHTNLSQQEELDSLIYQAIQTKAKVVAQDEKEKGIRAALNYGHTFGHVIENLTHYKVFLHGEAVAIGMMMANDLAHNLGLLSAQEKEAITHLLAKYGLHLPYKIPNAQEFYAKFFLDKKSSDNAITFILPNGIGDVLIRNDIPKEAVMEVLEQWSEAKA